MYIYTGGEPLVVKKRSDCIVQKALVAPPRSPLMMLVPSFGKTQAGRHLGLHIGRKAGIGQGFDISALDIAGAGDLNAVPLFINPDPHLLQLSGDAVHMLRNDIANGDAAACSRHSGRVSAFA